MTRAQLAIERKPLRVLIVEDNPDDAELVLHELRRGGFEPYPRRVETAEDMREALGERGWDLVISDYSLPTFDAPRAFAVMRELHLDLPFIVVSGTVGEDVAVEVMRMGVHDFLVKGHLRRLVAAIERELREAAVRAERKRIQEELVISERMASVGTLAAGVAHEINNPLSVILGNLHVITEEIGGLSKHLEAFPAEIREALGERLAVLVTGVASIREAAQDAGEAGERARVIARDLRVFARSEGETRQPIDVHAVLESSLRMARGELLGRAAIVRQFGDVPKVSANEARLGQVFLNLIVNAAQAMSDQGPDRHAITITTSRVEGMVAVDVADTGSGIPPEILPRIFDVFFTTKPIGVGTGLGLSICHQIVTAMDGRIEVHSRPGSGATFRVLLPRAKTGRTTPVPMVPTPAAPSRRLAVLVIDDEPAVGRTLQRLLVPHEVTFVSRASEALRRLGGGQQFDAVICDLMMPDLTGMDFHAELKRVDPAAAARVIFMSGGPVIPGAREFLEAVSNPRVDKPIDAEKLRLLVENSTTTVGWIRDRPR